MAKTQEIVLYAMIFLLAGLSYLVMEPFIGYVIMGFLIAFLFYPVYRFLSRFMWEGLSAVIVLLITLLLIILPSVYLAGTLIGQATNAYQRVQEIGVGFDEEGVSSLIATWTGMDVHDQVTTIFDQGRQFLKSAIPGIITSTGLFLLGLFILFFVLYYALREGDSWYETVCGWLPIGKKEQDRIMTLMKRQSKALLYGLILTSALISIVIGLFMWWFGIPNVVFWAFLMFILGIIPIAGAPFVYVPAGIYLFLKDMWWQAVALVVLSIAVHLFIDNILRPKLVSKASEIHPTLVILGALGGVALLGFVGFLVGPLILSFFFILMDVQKS